jgi:hypothetical protein
MSIRFAQTQFTLNGGEVSTRFEARQEQNKYGAAVARAENWIPMVLGGMRRREGTVFVAETGGEGEEKVLIPFKFSTEQAYMLEFGHEYVRFFKNGAPILVGGIPLEVTTPYPASMLRHIKMSAYQSADVMYIPSDGTLPVYKLRRIATDTFDLIAVNFRSPATVEAELTGTELGGMTMTPGATTGDTITFTASSSVFLAADVGLAINGPDGARAVINTVTDSTHVVADIIDPFTDTSAIPADDWSLRGTPAANLNPSKTKKGGAIKVLADEFAFRQAYVGKYILVYGGLIEVRSVKNSKELYGTILSDMIDRDASDPSETAFWSLEESAWTAEEGYPTAGCFYQERMWLSREQTRWGSNSGDFENFAKGSDDSAGIARTMSDDEINDIRWLKASANGLFSATGGGMYQATASNKGAALTPNDFNEVPITGLGTANIAPVRIEGILLYVQDGGRSFIEQSYNFVDDKFDSPDMFLLASHLTEFNEILAVTYQRRPDSIVWSVRDDGQMLTLTYRRAEQVAGWARQVTDGRFLDVAVIPRPESASDWVWVIVEREIEGVKKKYVEYFEHFNGSTCREWRAAMTDSAVFREPELNESDEIIVTGLAHLEGKTVRVIGDGLLFNDAVVSGGQIVVSPQIPNIEMYEVGLDYVSDGLTLEPVIPAERGGPLMARSWVEIAARFRRTLGMKLNGEAIPFRQAADPMDAQVPLKRGKKFIPSQKCDGEGRISFVQDVPFPAEILNIMGRLQIGDEAIAVLWPEDEPEYVGECREEVAAARGFMSNQCGLVCQLGQYAEAAIGAAFGGVTRSGVAIRTTSGSSRNNYTGLAAIYLSATEEVVLMSFDHQPLTALGTVHATVEHALAYGDLLRIEASTIDPTEYTVKVNGTAVIGPVILSDAVVDPENSCVGTLRIADEVEE